MQWVVQSGLCLEVFDAHREPIQRCFMTREAVLATMTNVAVREWQLADMSQPLGVPQIVEGTRFKEEEMKDFICYMQQHRARSVPISQKRVPLRSLLRSANQRSEWYTECTGITQRKRERERQRTNTLVRSHTGTLGGKQSLVACTRECRAI